MSSNVAAILEKVAHDNPDRAAFLHGTDRVTFSALAEDVARMAARLHHEGIRPGDNILILAPISIPLYVSLLGVLHAGAIAVVVDIWGGRQRIDEACATIPIRAFITTLKGQLLRLLSPVVRRIPTHIICGTSNRRFDPVPVAERDPDSPALITFTTGSTGRPKGAVRTHRFLMAQHNALVRSLGLVPNEISMPTLPILTLSNLALGTTTVIPRADRMHIGTSTIRRVVRDLQRSRATSMIGSPSFFENLASELIATGERIESMRRICLGGAPVFPPLAELLLRAFPDVAITIVYGSTEAEPISTINAEDLILQQPSDGLPVGRPIQGISVRIIDIVDDAIDCDRGQDLIERSLPSGTTGEICVAGDHVLARYYHNEEAFRRSKIVLDDVIWHRTGDAGWMDAGGDLHLMGRVRERIVQDGGTHFLFPIEQRLVAEPGIVLGTVVTLRGACVLIVEPMRGTSIDQTLRQRIIKASGIRIDRTVVMTPIPRDPRHRSKIDYDAVRRRLENGGTTPS